MAHCSRGTMMILINTKRYFCMTPLIVVVKVSKGIIHESNSIGALTGLLDQLRPILCVTKVSQKF
jgi:hypothetical protein